MGLEILVLSLDELRKIKRKEQTAHDTELCFTGVFDKWCCCTDSALDIASARRRTKVMFNVYFFPVSLLYKNKHSSWHCSWRTRHDKALME